MTYNGWSNYETWAVGMFLDGNYDGEGLHREAQDTMRQAYRDAEPRHGLTVGEIRVIDVTDAIERFVKDRVVSDGYDGIRGDLIGAALSEVDWRELAEHYVADLVE